jgi:hypothetical protein
MSEEVLEWETIAWEDLSVVARVRGEWVWEKENGKSPHAMGYEIYEGMSEDLDNPDIERMMHGQIKWDGCSHNYFGDKDGYIHGCSRYDMARLGEIFSRLWLKAHEVMGTAMMKD